jgi:hypothetical protein
MAAPNDSSHISRKYKPYVSYRVRKNFVIASQPFMTIRSCSVLAIKSKSLDHSDAQFA